jgi:hypothetical protein
VTGMEINDREIEREYNDLIGRLAVCRIFGSIQEITKRDISAIIAEIPRVEVF